MISLRKVSPGEPITAEWANAVVDAVLGLGRIVGVPPVQVQHSELGTQIGVAGLPRLDLVELKDSLQSGDTDKQAKQFRYDPGATDKWIDANQILEHTADPQHGLYLAGERHLAFFHPAAGQRIPIPGVQFHLGKLAGTLNAGSSATAKIYKGSDGADSGLTVTVHDWLLSVGQFLLAGTQVALLQHLESKRFYVVAFGRLKAQYIFGTLSETLTGADDCECSVELALDGPSPGGSVSVFQPLDTFFSGDEGAAFHAIYSYEDDNYYFVWVAC